MKAVSNIEVYKIISRTLGIMNKEMITHGEMVGYTLLKMLKADGSYTESEIAKFTLIAILHDMGIIKTGSNKRLVDLEMNNVWGHSIYGYLFLKYLSPVDDMAEIVLYHHLDYRLHKYIKSDYIEVAEYLALADKMDVYMRMKGHNMKEDYFQKNINVEFSARALTIFNKAQDEYNVMDSLAEGNYKKELYETFENADFDSEFCKKMLQTIIYSIDFRSLQTVVHSLATTSFAVAIARLMDMPENEVEKLYYGALLHDIGKIAIPLEILEAPRKLSQEEMRIMKAHVLITEIILKDAISDDIFLIATRHHEKLDGSGYPLGITGEDINKSQRILAVADIMSALYGKRSYKESFDSKKVIEIMHNDVSDGKICPKAALAATEHFDAIVRFYEKQREQTMGIYTKIQEQYQEIHKRFEAFE